MLGEVQPVAVYGLEVPSGDMMVHGNPSEFPAPGKYRITMAAIDPTQEPTEDGPKRATLKIIRLNYPLDDDSEDDEDDEDFDSDDVEAIEARLGMVSDDSDSESGGGPGEKTKKARAEALKKAIKAAEEEDAMELELVNGVGSKGKGKASDDEDEDEDDSDLEDMDEDELDEYPVCTLDPERNYQQPLDITVDVREQVFFKVTGPYNVYLTGNYLAASEFEDDYEDSEDEDEDGLEALGDLEGLSDEEDYSEEDELDGLDDPRVMEVDSEEEEAPKLVKAKKDSKKRAADDSEEDDVLAKVLKAEPAAATNGEKLSKSQKKKLKNNEGKASEAPAAEVGAKKETPVKAEKKEQANGSDKKTVKFAEKLEQGPSAKSDPKAAAANGEKKSEKKQWKVQGVSIDERKAGSGRQAKPGDKIGMRYIGKLKDGKVFDSNTKGEPFKFKLGKGEVIKGWDIGVAGMAVGSERRLTIPANLAYGKQKTGGIPPNSELTFDVKLISIN